MLEDYKKEKLLQHRKNNAKLTETDKIELINRGNSALDLIKSASFEFFIMQRKFYLMDAISNIDGCAEADNQRKLKYSAELNAIANLVTSIQVAIADKERIQKGMQINQEKNKGK